MADETQPTEAAPAAPAARGAAKPEKSKSVSEPTQSFVARFSIVTPAGTLAPGDAIELTRAAWDELTAIGAIDGVWTD